MKVLARLRRNPSVRSARSLDWLAAPDDDQWLVHTDHLAALIAAQDVVSVARREHSHCIMAGRRTLLFGDWPQTSGMNY